MPRQSAGARRTLEALAIAPLTAPVLYWIGSLVPVIADPDRHLSLRSAVGGLGIILLAGGLVAYLAALVGATPALVMLRRWNVGAYPGVLGIGAIVGAATAFVLRPFLRGDLFSIILTPWQGAGLGCASAGVFCWLNLRSRNGHSSGEPGD